MITRVNGTTSFSFFVARSRYSNWPDQVIEYPGGSATRSADEFLRLPRHTAEVAPTDVDVDPAVEPRILASDLRRSIGDYEICDRPSVVVAPAAVTIGSTRSFSTESRSSRG